MLMKPEPIDRAFRSILKGKQRRRYHVVFLTPQGKPLKQSIAARLAKRKHLVFLCGHYEGVDERIRNLWVDQEISIGDYVLTGGELPAMVVMDTVVRLIPGVLGNEDSKNFESFTQDLLEYAQYTRPQVFRGLSVPRELLTGNHRLIAEWRQKKALSRTRQRRKDLLLRKTP